MNRTGTPSPATLRIAGHALVEALIAQGVDTAFGVPGESYLAVLDGFHEHRERIRFIACRQEGGAAFMAEAQGKLTGRPGICFVTRGPGATNASIGLHTAFQDSTPMILFVGQVASDQRDREAFQELDYRQMFGPGTLGMAKWVGEVHSADRLPEYVARAFHTAMQGRPGPVVLVLPEDMLTTPTAAPVLPRVEPAQAWPAPGALRDLRALLRAGAAAVRDRRRRRLGCRGRRARCSVSPRTGSCRWAAPSASRTLSTTATRSTPATWASASIRSSPRASATPTCVHRPGRAPGRDDHRRLHAAARRRGRSRSWCTSMPAPRNSAVSMRPTCCCRPRWPAPPRRWRRWPRRRSCLGVPRPRRPRADYAANRVPPPVSPLDMAQVVQTVERLVPEDTVYTNGAGNFSGWLHRYCRYPGLQHHGRTQLAPTSGAMGYGVPAAVAAALLYPERTVINVAGDGDFLMTGQELATATGYGAGRGRAS